ncbi:NnrU family protein [Oceanicoccus sagamiensis]|uniref:NnrU domain-containing protein n=1 Tax=Oceanicoccus sagamiensis TaxID=716816 RepID=A0A1X9NJF9_9GAMM|nr:NnrU family protein [Oceanicoccus sagamiensis]ARN75609.1 hypothetical protein BST96_16755 [Oceanicoccus sagamiensis]
MTLLIVGLIIFFGMHLLPNIGDSRAKFIDRFGEKLYMPVYAVVSLVGMVMAVRGRNSAEFVTVWTPPAWGVHVSMLLMLVSIVLFAAMFLPTNIKRKVHHPMLGFVGAWGLAHLFSNGDMASLIFFGGFFVFSVFKTISLTRRKPPEPYAPVAVTKDIVVLILAAIVYAALLFAHPYVSGGYALLT